MRLVAKLFFVVLALQLAAAAGAGLIYDAKVNCPNGTCVQLEGRVTAVFRDCAYVEDLDGKAGIKVVNMPACVGACYSFGGVMRTDSHREREVLRTATPPCKPIPTPQMMLSALPLPIDQIGGIDLCLNPRTGCGQVGAFGANGANNVGLFVEVWGTVTHVNTLYRYFYVANYWEDRWDGSGYAGVRVSYADVALPRGMAPVRVGLFATVQGISTLDPICGRAQSVIRTRSSEDIAVWRGPIPCP